MSEIEFEQFQPDLAEAMREVSQGDGLPGYLGIQTLDVGPGRMRAAVKVRDELKNPFGSLHGGVLSALVDHVLGAVLYPVISPGSWAATTEFKLNLVKPVRAGDLIAESRIVALGRRSAVVVVEAINDGRLVGLAQGTVTIMPADEQRGNGAPVRAS